MASYRKDLRGLIRKAEAAGWRVVVARSGHVKFFPPDGKTAPCVAGGTPSDHRSWANLLACLRRKGLDV